MRKIIFGHGNVGLLLDHHEANLLIIDEHNENSPITAPGTYQAITKEKFEEIMNKDTSIILQFDTLDSLLSLKEVIDEMVEQRLYKEK